MKVIKITKCEECPFCNSMWMTEEFDCIERCSAIDETGTSINAIITDPNQIKPNCPLEDAPIAHDTGVFLGG